MDKMDINHLLLLFAIEVTKVKLLQNILTIITATSDQKFFLI